MKELKGKIGCYALLVFASVWYLLYTQGLYTLLRQEEVQLFLPVWSELSGQLLTPGGSCEVLGKFLVQHYTSPLVSCILLSTLITAIGVLTYLLFERQTSRGYHFLLALFPVMALVKAHCSFFYVADGTIGLLFVLLFIYGYSRFNHPVYTWVSTLLVYALCGQLVALYGLLLLTYSLLTTPDAWKHPLGATLLALGLTYYTLRWTTCVPLTDGIYSRAYQESQLQPDSYLYFVTLRFCVLLWGILVTDALLQKLPNHRKGFRWGLNLVAALAFGLFAYTQLPSKEDIINNEMEELAYLAKQRDWEGILQKYETHSPTNYVQQNYICLALAHKGTLGDQLFRYNPKGPQSLLPAWDHRYYTSVLLSDIHWAIGDISLSESYAMEGLTLAKRGGSACMMQRLVQISLLRQEWGLARKYLSILHQLPAYRTWAETYQAYLYHPEKFEQVEELSGHSLSTQTDNLFSLLSIDSLWTEHLKHTPVNPIAQAYLGCSYLLAKELQGFESFLLETASASPQPLPKHFQEALLIRAIDHPSLLEKLPVDKRILNRFKQFRQDVSTVSKDNRGLMQLHQNYGNTYWFYYYCKN